MDFKYRTFDTENEHLYVGVCNHYFNLTDAKEVYRNKEEKDNSIMIEVGRKDTKEIEAVVTCGVDEAEQIALTLLNLCNSIKR
ncbi:hypothetical protein [Oceanobacillus halotolerans]|uniref:hypothetical protein n=1 Tax=Oceanobacillus halotolerans TaxID=2663380 RepID=UPI0013DA5CB4|nr:hypothetical protein [Oceanobacillus halotolerans]